jgi:hypothetical protein
MKINVLIALLALTLLSATTTALAQQPTKPSPRPTPAGEPGFSPEKENCPCVVAGTWKAQISKTEARLYEFDNNGVVKVLAVSGNDKPREVATAQYQFIAEPITEESAAATQKTPDIQISFTATGKNRIFGRTNTTMKVVSYDDSSLTCEIPGVAEPVRWTRVDADRYFIILVARQNEFYNKSGSAFPMVIKLSGGVPKIDAAGSYSDHGEWVFGAVPPEVYKNYLREAHGDSEVILRLEINSQQYDRALKVVQEWQRRAREHALLYQAESPASLNNVVLVWAVTETLNLCEKDFDLYQLDYVYPRDWITENYSPEFIPFVFFQELRRRNEARHIDYKKFQELVPLPNLASR